jgi:hypothetical protein
MKTGLFIVKLSVQCCAVCLLLTSLPQNIAAESDEEEDLNQLQAIEQKLLAYDPTFTLQHTHASIATQRSALISAFRPQYEEGDVEGETTVAFISLATEFRTQVSPESI